MQVRSESVCALVFRRAASGIQYLMLRRSARRGGFWQSVSGHVKRGEGAEDAARREVLEETGFEPMAVIPVERVNVFYLAQDDAVCLEPCFGVEVGGGEAILSHEHDAHCWATSTEALSLLPFAGVRDALIDLDRQLAAGDLTVQGPADARSLSPGPE